MSATHQWMDHQEEAWERDRDHLLTTTPTCEHEDITDPGADVCGAPGELVGDTILCPRHAEERP